MSTPGTSKIGFLDLPAELRDAVYELHLDTIAHLIPFPLLRSTTQEIESNRRPSHLTLLLVSKQIRREALNVLCAIIQPTLDVPGPHDTWRLDYRDWTKDILSRCEKLNQAFGDHLRSFKSIRVEGWESLLIFCLEQQAIQYGLENAASARVLARLRRVESMVVHDVKFANGWLFVSADEPWLAFSLRTRRVYDDIMHAMPKLREIVCDSGRELQVCRVEPDEDSWRIVAVESGVAMVMEDWG